MTVDGKFGTDILTENGIGCQMRESRHAEGREAAAAPASIHSIAGRYGLESSCIVRP